MKKKIPKVYEDHGLGFPVTLLNVPMIEVRGEWVPKMNQKELRPKKTFAFLLSKAYRLKQSSLLRRTSN